MAWYEERNQEEQNMIERDLLDIEEMSGEKSALRMIESLKDNNMDTLQELERLKIFGRDRALWFLLYCSKSFQETMRQLVFENPTGWTAYNVPLAIDLHTLDERAKIFGDTLGKEYYNEEMRGKYCVAEYKKPVSDLVQFSAYPEDYGKNDIGYDNLG